jgi:signal transduction histidine kinase
MGRQEPELIGGSSMEVWAEHRNVPVQATGWTPDVAPELRSRSRLEAFAVVRDELRAPLLGLEALVEALAGGPLSQEVTERMHDQSRVLARRVSLLIEDLAVVAAPDPGAIVLDPGVLDLDDELAECAASFPDMVIRVDADAGLRVHADALRLHQVLANLVRNAHRAGCRPVSIRATGRSDYVSVQLSEAGPADSHEVGIVRLLVQVLGGITIHELDGPFTFTVPRAPLDVPVAEALR